MLGSAAPGRTSLAMAENAVQGAEKQGTQNTKTKNAAIEGGQCGLSFIQETVAAPWRFVSRDFQTIEIEPRLIDLQA